MWAHLPFYTILLPAFLELCYSQTAYNTKTAMNNVYRVRVVVVVVVCACVYGGGGGGGGVLMTARVRVGEFVLPCWGLLAAA